MEQKAWLALLLLRQKEKVKAMAEASSLATDTLGAKKVQEEERKSPYGLPLPSELVRVLEEDDVGDRELLIVGDIHGCYDELKEMMDSNNITKENTCVIFVGDLINKGPKSGCVIDYVMENGWYSVRGNHDEISMLEYNLSKSGEPQEKFQWVKNLQQEQVDWLSQLPYAVHIPSRQIIVVHAGLLPGVTLDLQIPNVFLHIRCVKSVEDRWEWTKQFLEDQELWGSVWSGPEHVYYGHDAKRQFIEFPHATGLDSGCVYGLKLTAIYPATRKLLQVKAHKNYKIKQTYNQLQTDEG